MADDLTAFLTARLDEDEASARDVRYIWPTSFEITLNPARVLREVEAGRAILTLHNRTHECPIGSAEQSAVKGPWLYIASEHVEVAGTEWPCTTLRHLAAVYSGHPDYRQEWAPAPATISP